MKNKATVICDKNNNPLLNCMLPEGFSVTAESRIEATMLQESLKIICHMQKGNCHFYYRTGDSYILEKYDAMANPLVQDRPKRNLGGSHYATPKPLQKELDDLAAQIAGKKLNTLAFYDLPDKQKQKAEETLRLMMDRAAVSLNLGAQISPVPVGNVITNYLCDGMMAVYAYQEKTLALLIMRIGFEYDIVPQPGIMENISHERFGSAPITYGAVNSNAEWTIPFLTYMISDDPKDLSAFMEFAESIEDTEELIKYTEQLWQKNTQRQYQMALQQTQQNQAMWNMLFAQQQQQFAAMDRLSASLHQDLDSFHNNLFQQINASDLRIQTGPDLSQEESWDEKIQRQRHEAMMGVDTYDREDGSTVEYSTMADRVFENNLDSTQHFGTHNYFDDYVPEGWHELKKK